MKKYLSVVFLLLLNGSVYAADLASAISDLEREWATVYYNGAKSDPSGAYRNLLDKTKALAKQFPDQPDPLLWQAIIISSDADHQSPLKALEQITQARDLLLHVIKMAPDGVNGSAHVTLGVLYYMTPAWPLSFGDIDKARELLTTALKINPESIEANYFYGDFLVTQNQPNLAAKYFKKAIASPVRQDQQLADKSLQQQATLALNEANQHNFNSDSKKIFLSLFSGSKDR